MGKVIADTGAIYALADRSDRWHERVKRFVQKESPTLILPNTTLPEICYLINKYLGQDKEEIFLRAILQGELAIEEVGLEDIRVALDYMRKYRELNLGFVDASVLAVARRLRVYDLLTTDRRDFSSVKVNGRELNLLP